MRFADRSGNKKEAQRTLSIYFYFNNNSNTQPAACCIRGGIPFPWQYGGDQYLTEYQFSVCCL